VVDLRSEIGGRNLSPLASSRCLTGSDSILEISESYSLKESDGSGSEAPKNLLPQVLFLGSVCGSIRGV